MRTSLVAFLGELYGLDVYLGDQRTGGVDDPKSALPARIADFRRYAVSAVNYAFTVWTSSTLSTKMAPLPWSSSTTKRLWTISLRT